MLQRLRRSPDDGLTLIECVIALTLFGVLAATVAALLGTVLKETKNNQNRTQAAGLATRIIDRLHAVPASQLPEGQSAPQTFTADGNVFTVVTTTGLVGEGAGIADSACDSGGALSARRISVIVTWAGMGSTKSVRSDTLRQLSVGEVDPTKGVIAVKIVDRNIAPASGHTVLLGSKTFTTGTDGCAVFTGLTPGSYTASVATPGYVDPIGTAAPSRGVVATAGLITKDPGFIYDRAASLVVTYRYTSGGPTTYPPLTGTGISLGNSAFTGGARSYPICGSAPCAVAGAPGTVSGLFPSTLGYRAWAGACADARAGTVPAATVLPPGGSAATTVDLDPVEVYVKDRSGNAISNASVSLSHTSDTGCTPGTTATLTTDAAGRASVALPSGAWRFSYTKYFLLLLPETLTVNSTLVAGSDVTTVTLRSTLS